MRDFVLQYPAYEINENAKFFDVSNCSKAEGWCSVIASKLSGYYTNYTEDLEKFTSFLELGVVECKTVSQTISLKEHFLITVCVRIYIPCACVPSPYAGVTMLPLREWVFGILRRKVDYFLPRFHMLRLLFGSTGCALRPPCMYFGGPTFIRKTLYLQWEGNPNWKINRTASGVQMAWGSFRV